MKSKIIQSMAFSLIPFFVVSCANPQKVQIKLPKEKVTKKISRYTSSLDILGKMTIIYDSKSLKIQSKGIQDDTGTAQATGGEIPVDITEMIKTSLNKIGGSIQYIDYDPSHQSNMMALGYTNFQNKAIPNLVLSGGITEFDRSLEVRGSGTDASAEGTFGGHKYGADYGDSNKTSSASITLDINLIDFETWAMIPKMSASNKVTVYSGIGSSELGFSIMSLSFGVNGNIKKVQGRHAATRLLVELSMIEVIGRYLDLPYWKLLPNGKVDKVVIRSASNRFLSAYDQDRALMIQKAIYLHGYDIALTGVIDEQTIAIIDKYKKHSEYVGKEYDSLELFKDLYINVPIDNNFRMASIFTGFAPLQEETPPQPQPEVLADSTNIVETPQEQSQEQVQPQLAPAPNIQATGVFNSRLESLAINMATNMAINSLAKKLGKVIQSEYSNVMNENVLMKITTNAKNIVSGYRILSKKYENGRAEVIIELDGQIIDAQIEKQIEKDSK